MNESDSSTAQTEMPRYQCHKKVWALKIAEVKDPTNPGDESDGSRILVISEPGYAPIKVNSQFVNKNRPEAGGYYVVLRRWIRVFLSRESIRRRLHENLNPRIYIAVPCHNRKAIVKQCLPTIRAAMQTGDLMVAYDDGSKEYGPTFLEQWADLAVREPTPIGVERQRANHFRAFWASDFDFLYLTDSDALHSIHWRTQAERLVNECDGSPVCLYNTDAHVRLGNNTIVDDPKSDVIWRRVAPGALATC
jgi:hypothetical protein